MISRTQCRVKMSPASRSTVSVDDVGASPAIGGTQGKASPCPYKPFSTNHVGVTPSGYPVNINLFCICLILIIFLSSGICHAQIQLNAKNAYIFTDSQSYEELDSLIYKISSQDGIVSHVFPNKTLFGKLSDENIQDKNISDHIKYFTNSDVDLDTIRAYNDNYAYVAALIWNNNHVGMAERFQKESLKEAAPLPLKQDLFLDSASLCNRTTENIKNSLSSYGAGFCDTSEYMIGNISVTIIFPESQGEGDENTEDWDIYSDQYTFLTRVEDAMDWWVRKEPAAKLRFIYEWMTKPVSIEPINHNYCQEKVWTQEIMTGMGFNNYDNYLDNVRDFNNSQRAKYTSDWAFTIFPVNANNDPDGNFKKDVDPDCPGSYLDWFAWSWLGGPFSIIAYKKSQDYLTNKPFNAIVAHETAHIFYALDEYLGSGSYCTQSSGYLDVENQNYEENCLLNEPCLMRTYAGVAFYQDNLCLYTREQVGWKDSDQNGILDILDFDPVSSIISISNSPNPTISCLADCTKTLPNKNTYEPGSDITVNKIAKVEYSIDNTSWFSANPDDGRFDSALENFTINLSSPTSGNNTLEIKTTTNFGNESIQTFENIFPTENLYFPVANSENSNTVLIATNFSPSSSDCSFSFKSLNDMSHNKSTSLTVPSHASKYIDLQSLGINEAGYGVVIKSPDSQIKFYAYSLDFNTLRGYELQVKKPIFQEGLLPLWIVSPQIKVTSNIYIFNVGNTTSKFEILIKDKTSKTKKDLTFNLDASKGQIINLQDYFGHESQGHILIYSEGANFTADCVISGENLGVIAFIQGIEKPWK